jgi:hypothetical protein
MVTNSRHSIIDPYQTTDTPKKFRLSSVKQPLGSTLWVTTDSDPGPSQVGRSCFEKKQESMRCLEKLRPFKHVWASGIIPPNSKGSPLNIPRQNQLAKLYLMICCDSRFHEYCTFVSSGGESLSLFPKGLSTPILCDARKIKHRVEGYPHL